MQNPQVLRGERADRFVLRGPGSSLLRGVTLLGLNRSPGKRWFFTEGPQSAAQLLAHENNLVGVQTGSHGTAANGLSGCYSLPLLRPAGLCRAAQVLEDMHRLLKNRTPCAGPCDEPGPRFRRSSAGRLPQRRRTEAGGRRPVATLSWVRLVMRSTCAATRWRRASARADWASSTSITDPTPAL